MKNLSQIKKKITKENGKLYLQNSSKILAEFFNGVVIEFEEHCKYDS